MNEAHLHLLTNHVSLFALAFGLLLLLLGLLRKSDELKLGASVLFVIAAIMFFPAKETGGGASKLVKPIAGVNKDAIKDHAGASKWVMPFTTALGVLSLVSIAWFWKRKNIPGWATIGMLMLALFGFGTISRTAYLGGFIRHTEVHATGGEAPAEDSGKADDADDQ